MLALLNAMHMKGQLDPVQARFMARQKPVEELYDLKNDPHETKNLADDPKYAAGKKKLRGALDSWRERTGDHEISDEFRQGGWPAEYPTRSLAEWERILAGWEKHLFSGGPQPVKRRGK